MASPTGTVADACQGIRTCQPLKLLFVEPSVYTEWTSSKHTGGIHQYDRLFPRLVVRMANTTSSGCMHSNSECDKHNLECTKSWRSPLSLSRIEKAFKTTTKTWWRYTTVDVHWSVQTKWNFDNISREPPRRSIHRCERDARVKCYWHYEAHSPSHGMWFLSLEFYRLFYSWYLPPVI